MADITITRACIYELLHLADWPDVKRRRKLAKLMACHGFPKPLPGFFDVWSRLAVERWVNGGVSTGAAPLTAEPVDPITALRDRLERSIRNRQKEVAA